MKIRLFLLLLAIILLLSSCAQTDSVVSHSEETKQDLSIEDPRLPLYVNTATKKIHYHKDCRYLLQSNEENIVTMEYTEETLQSLLSMAYASCHNCN